MPAHPTRMSDQLNAELLLQAYASGIFPMAESRDDPEVFWVDPVMRGVFPLDQFHISKSLARAIRRENYTVRLNSDFAGVVSACADRPETWINDQIFELYNELHNLGFAHSLEIWGDTDLIGGVYGIALNGAFFGESMFSKRTNASKIALAYLVTLLRNGGFQLFDTQFITPHLESLGAIEITRADYRAKLAEALQINADIIEPLIPDAYSVVQFNTQTS